MPTAAGCLLLMAAMPGCSSDSDDDAGGAAGASAGAGAGGKSGSGAAGSQAGTSGSAGSTAGADAGTDTTADPNALIGTFALSLIAPTESETAGHATLVGTVYDGATPPNTVWEEAKTVGDCTLSTPRVPFCNTPCGGSAVCVEDDACQPYPTKKNVGKVTVSGVKTSAGDTGFVMSAVANTYQAPPLPYLAFAEGDSLGVAAEGGDLSAFTVSTLGVKPLELSSTKLQLDDGQPLALTWPAAASASASSIHVKLDISHHGGSKGMIECDSQDTGSLTIDAALISLLLDKGVAGFPTIIVTRHSDGTAQLPQGKVAFVTQSQVEEAVTIPGLTSCGDATDCPSGQTCQIDLTCK